MGSKLRDLANRTADISYFATCARGLEPVLTEELYTLKAEKVTPGRGGVGFSGPRDLLYRANLWLRTAVRVLQPILEAVVADADELYQAVQTVDWTQYLTPTHTLAVDCNVRDSGITHSLFAARRVKDAICDQFISKTGKRPSVDTDRPMLGLNLHIHRDKAILSLDSSWDSLHKRGYRPALTVAPLNEALAAGLLWHTGWRGDVPLVDPMCGSGVFSIEGAWLAVNRPPGLTRKHFGFMGWMDYDVRLWADLRDEARAGVKKQLPAPIIGQDIRGDVKDFAAVNAKTAGVGHLVRFEKADVRKFQPPPGPPGVIVINPPYGERIGEEREVKLLYRDIGKAFAATAAGWQVFVFTSRESPWREFGLKLEKATPFFNGKIECQLLKFVP